MAHRSERQPGQQVRGGVSATGDRMEAIASQAVAQCMEHGAESAVMLVTWTGDGTSHMVRLSKGNWYANRGACADFLDQQSVPEDQA